MRIRAALSVLALAWWAGPRAGLLPEQFTVTRTETSAGLVDLEAAIDSSGLRLQYNLEPFTPRGMLSLRTGCALFSPSGNIDSDMLWANAVRQWDAWALAAGIGFDYDRDWESRLSIRDDQNQHGSFLRVAAVNTTTLAVNVDGRLHLDNRNDLVAGARVTHSFIEGFEYSESYLYDEVRSDIIRYIDYNSGAFRNRGCLALGCLRRPEPDSRLWHYLGLSWDWYAAEIQPAPLENIEPLLDEGDYPTALYNVQYVGLNERYHFVELRLTTGDLRPDLVILERPFRMRRLRTQVAFDEASVALSYWHDYSRTTYVNQWQRDTEHYWGLTERLYEDDRLQLFSNFIARFYALRRLFCRIDARAGVAFDQTATGNRYRAEMMANASFGLAFAIRRRALLQVETSFMEGSITATRCLGGSGCDEYNYTDLRWGPAEPLIRAQLTLLQPGTD